jgi:protease I
MANELAGKRIAFLVANVGVEQVELTEPWKAVMDAGGVAVLLAPEKDDVQTVDSDTEPGGTYPVDELVADSSVGEFDGLVLPGGVANPDKLRTVTEAVALVKSFVDARKPIASICHGPWSLVEADVLGGKTLTSWPSLTTDIRNAGGTWVDEEQFTCTANGWTLVTSRNPGDLPAFTKAIVESFAD